MRQGIVALCVAVVLNLPCPGVRAEEEKVALDKLPKAVVGAVKKMSPKAKLVSASKETADKKVVYEVQFKEGEESLDVAVSPEGKILEVEKEIPVKSLPKAVTDALGLKYPKAVLKKAERVSKGKEKSFEVLVVTQDKKTVEVKLDPQGKILGTEEQKEKNEQ